MMQTTDLRYFDHSSHRWRLHRPGNRRIFRQAQVSARFLIIVKIGSQNAAQAALVEDEDMVETLAPNGADQPFDISILPGRTSSREDFVDAHGARCCAKQLAVAGIAVAQKESRRCIPGKGMPKLLRRPLGRVMGSGAEMHNPATIMGEDDEDKEQLECCRRYHKEVCRNQLLHVVLQECLPGLRRGPSGTHHVLGDCGFADVDAELQEFAMNAGSIPAWVGQTHFSYEISNLTGLTRSALVYSALPCPIQSEPFAVPRNDSVCLHDPDMRAPALPQTRQPNPEDSINGVKPHPPVLGGTLQHKKLMAQGQDLGLQSSAGVQRASKRG